MNRYEISVNKANPLREGETIADLKIEATHGVDTEGMSLEDMRLFYTIQAGYVAEAMFNTLPGGLVDALLVEFMRRKVSLFAVPFTDDKTVRMGAALQKLREIQGEIIPGRNDEFIRAAWVREIVAKGLDIPVKEV